MTDNVQPFCIGVAGLGTVGAGLVKLLQDNQNIIAQRVHRPIKIISVIASNKNKDRGVDLSAYDWADSLSAMANDDRIDAVVEMIGGSEGQAKDFVEQALLNGKHVITANKALLAHHGFELAKLAEQNNVTIAYEAAVAGGIPIIKTMREGLAGNNITGVYGILNGTCNYILTEMRETGRSFGDVLKDAQEKGYAEADPSFDVDGIDAAHKLVLLGALAFGVIPDFDSLEIEGISHLTLKDIEQADDLGYRIKLIGMAQVCDVEGGKDFVQTMAPCFVPKNSAIGQVEGVFNAVLTQGDFVDTTMMEGRGAGAGPTASSVMADVIDLAAGRISPIFGINTNKLHKVEWKGVETLDCQCYIHLHVKDEPGVIADITAYLKEQNVSIDSLIQKGHEDDGTASVVIVTHKANFAEIQKAVDYVQNLPSVVNKPTVIRIEDL